MPGAAGSQGVGEQLAWGEDSTAEQKGRKLGTPALSHA